MKKTALLVLFYLLQDKANVNQSIRQIADITGVSLGSVHSVLNDLRERGFLIENGPQRMLRKRGTIVEWWARGYAETLKSKLLIGRFTFLTPKVRNNWPEIILPDTLCWGGEPAAALRGEPIQPGRWDIYTADNADTLIATGRMIPNPQGEIFVYTKFWKSTETPAMVVYADLMCTDDPRCREIAEHLKTSI